MGFQVLSDSSKYKKHHQDALWTWEAGGRRGETGTRIPMGGPCRVFKAVTEWRTSIKEAPGTDSSSVSQRKLLPHKGIPNLTRLLGGHPGRQGHGPWPRVPPRSDLRIRLMEGTVTFTLQTPNCKVHSPDRKILLSDRRKSIVIDQFESRGRRWCARRPAGPRAPRGGGL